MKRRIAWLMMLCVLARAHVAAAARLERQDGLAVAYLEGTAYEIGRAHGELLRGDIEQVTSDLLSYLYQYLKVPIVRTLVVNWWLDRAWGQSLSSIPTDYIEELQGLSDGSGVSLKDLWRVHAVPDRTYACANFAAWGRATKDGRLIHMRTLDWNIGAGVQKHPVVFVVTPRGKRQFVSAGWAGFIGVLSGINNAGISIGQIGAKTADVSYQGLPMPFVIRKTLEDSGSLEQAIQAIKTAPRTVGINYIVADAKEPRAVAMETTHRFAAVFQADDPAEHAVDYARPMPDAVFRADTAVDINIRDQQIASGGIPNRLGLEPPTGSAYEIRYLGQAAGLLAYYHTLDVPGAQRIARAVAPASNIQSVIFAWPSIWVANADDLAPAARQPYHQFDAERMMRQEIIKTLRWDMDKAESPLVRRR